MDFLKDFGVNPILLAAQVVNFLILLFILKKLLYGPILKVLEERRKKVEDSLRGAEEIERRLLELSEKEDAVLTKAASEGQKLINEASTQGAQIIDEAKKGAEVIVGKAYEDAKQAMVSEKDKMLDEVRIHIAEVVGVTLQKVTGKIINKKDQKEIVERSIKNLS